MHRHLALLTALLLLGATVSGNRASAAGASNIGVTAAVRNSVQGTTNGATTALMTGSTVYQNETVHTGIASNAQLLFRDQTTLSIGPSSDVVLDQFVYDPQQSGGQVVLSATRGAFRFTTGSQNPNNYTLKTPTASIGVRGTIVEILVQPDGSTLISLVEGHCIITFGDGSTVELDMPGEYVVSGNGATGGAIVTAANGVNFPFFGTGFAGEPHDFDLPDPIEDLDEELKSHVEEEKNPCDIRECCIDCNF